MENSGGSVCSNTGFRGASGSKDNTEPGARGGTQGRGSAGLPAGVDKELLQQIRAEGGAEALQDFLAKSGMSANVMTPDQLLKRQQEIKKMKQEL